MKGLFHARNEVIKILENKNYELFQGDCLELMNSISDKSIDMILCDLPYGTTKCKWDAIIPFKDLWENYNRIIKDNGAILLFANEPFNSNLILSNLKNFKYKWIWEKPQGINPLMAKKQPLNNFEEIVVFYKKQPIYNPQFEVGKPYHIIRDVQDRKVEWDGNTYTQTETNNTGYRYPKRILKFKQEKGLHPTQKPVELLEYLIRTYTNEEEIVLDNCMGSGSTGVAALNLHRKFIGIELDENYFNIAKERIVKVA